MTGFMAWFVPLVLALLVGDNGEGGLFAQIGEWLNSFMVVGGG